MGNGGGGAAVLLPDHSLVLWLHAVLSYERYKLYYKPLILYFHTEIVEIKRFSQFPQTQTKSIPVVESVLPE